MEASVNVNEEMTQNDTTDISEESTMENPTSEIHADTAAATAKEDLTQTAVYENTVDEPVDGTDYEAVAEEDLRALREIFPEAHSIGHIAELDNPLRYAALRDMGLSPKEAYLATQAPVARYDNRRHLRGAVPAGAAGSNSHISAEELTTARELFSGLNDRDIQSLYKRVTK